MTFRFRSSGLQLGLRLKNRPSLIKQALTLAQMVDSEKCR